MSWPLLGPGCGSGPEGVFPLPQKALRAACGTFPCEVWKNTYGSTVVEKNIEPNKGRAWVLLMLRWWPRKTREKMNETTRSRGRVRRGIPALMYSASSEAIACNNTFVPLLLLLRPESYG